MAAAVDTTPTIQNETQTQNPHEKEVFRWFNYNVTPLFCEVLNDIEQHSYEKLDDEWWLTMFRELDIINKLDEGDTSETEKKIMEKVTGEFAKDFFTEAQLNELKKGLNAVYESFIFVVVGPPHYCRIPGCDGDCGVQPCGICIDCCRCPMYW